MKYFLTIGLLLIEFTLTAQSMGNLTGRLLEKNTQNPMVGVTVKLVNTPYTTFTDTSGKYSFKAIPPGQYQVKFNSQDSWPLTILNVIVYAGFETNHTVELIAKSIQLQTVEVNSNTKTVRAATLETPLSVQRLTSEEINTSPGGNFDISKIIQTLPGVTGSASTIGVGLRNDIIVRGGAPNENVFYLDGIEIPVINHFSTQGSAGGPQGILNVSFIEEVKLSSSAFDAKFDNALSSVFEFKQKRGNTEKLQGNLRIAANEIASSIDGPLSKSGKTTFLASARRSHLQYIFKVLDLPVRPNFWDFQFKVTHNLNSKTTLTLLGVGSIDDLSYALPKRPSPQKIYAINSSPLMKQWSYTLGLSLKKLVPNGYWNLVISRNYLNNLNEKYENNLSPIKDEKTFDYSSIDLGNNIRWDITKNLLGLKWTTGLNLVNVGYENSTFQLVKFIDIKNTLKYSVNTTNYNSNFNYNKYGAFFQVGKRAFNNRLGIAAGVRTDGNNFTQKGNEFMRQISPRIVFSWALSNQLTWNATVGDYYKLAPNTALGFKDNQGLFLNKDADYTRSKHYVVGLEYIPTEATRFTAEIFYKKYNQVPISLEKGVSLSNLGTDFDILGNEAIRTIGLGRSYGFEFFAQQKRIERFNGIFSYSFFRSSYTNLLGTYISSSWENIHLLSLTGGYKFNKNWELGIKFRYQGGTPYTPYDLKASKLNFATLGVGIYDYTKLNSIRNQPFHSSDFRIDKKYYFKKSTLDLYLDITNWYGANSVSPPYYLYKNNNDGSFVTTDGLPIKKDGSNAIEYVTYTTDTIYIIPSFGCIFEF